MNISQLPPIPTGILKGSGGSINIAIAGTDYPGLASTNVFSGANTFSQTITGNVSGTALTVTGAVGIASITAALAAGTGSGPTWAGASSSGGSITITSTSNATKGNINLGTSIYNEASNYLGLQCTPAAVLDVNQDVNGMINRRYGGTTRTFFMRANGTLQSPQPLINANSVCQHNFSGWDGTSFVAGALVNISVNGSVTTGSVPMQMRWSFMNNGATTLVQRVAFVNDGRVTIGGGSATGLVTVVPTADATAGSTMLVQDQTPSTGATGFVLKAGAGQGTNDILQIQTTGGTPGFRIQGGGASSWGPATLAYSSAISLDTTVGNLFKTTTVNATGNATINATSAGYNGQPLEIQITNDATSGKVITFGANFRSNGTLTGTASKMATILFFSDGTTFNEQVRNTGL